MAGALALCVLALLCMLPWLGVLSRRRWLVTALTIGEIVLVFGLALSMRIGDVTYCAGDEDCTGEAIGYWMLIVLPIATAVAMAIVFSGLIAERRLKRRLG